MAANDTKTKKKADEWLNYQDLKALTPKQRVETLCGKYGIIFGEFIRPLTYDDAVWISDLVSNEEEDEIPALCLVEGCQEFKINTVVGRAAEAEEDYRYHEHWATD